MADGVSIISRQGSLNSRFIDVTNGEKMSIPTNVAEVLEVNVATSLYIKKNFEVTRGAEIQNILHDWLGYLTNPDFITRYVFDKYKAKHLNQNITALSNVVYGTPNMGWTFYLLNDMVKHPSDIDNELLLTEGLFGFNVNGITAIENLVKFITVNEQNVGNDGRESLFTDDDF